MTVDYDAGDHQSYQEVSVNMNKIFHCRVKGKKCNRCKKNETKLQSETFSLKFKKENLNKKDIN
jgi:hypothetical protein